MCAQRPKAAGKVRLVTLGGSGHEPGLSGFVGKGMLDVSVAGEIFAAPGAANCIEALRHACAGGESALLIVLNHAGDVLAGKHCHASGRARGAESKAWCLTQEDISGPDPADRRGLVGCVAVYKVAGAAAEKGASLDACFEVAQRMENNMRTLAVAVRTATHPATGQPIFELGDDEMEIGMGQHGEAGTGRMQLKSADETAEIMLEKLLADLGAHEGEELTCHPERRGSNHADGALPGLPQGGAGSWRQRRSGWCAARSESSSPRRSRRDFR